MGLGAWKRSSQSIKLTIQEVKASISIFFTRMAPAHFFEVRNIASAMPLEALSGKVLLCVLAIGSVTAFERGVQKLGATYVDRFDFSNHHTFQRQDIDMIKRRLTELEVQFGMKPIVIITEEDYDRDPEVLKHLGQYKVWAVCVQLQFVSCQGCSVDQCKDLLAKLLGVKLSASTCNFARACSRPVGPQLPK